MTDQHDVSTADEETMPDDSAIDDPGEEKPEISGSDGSRESQPAAAPQAPASASEPELETAETTEAQAPESASESTAETAETVEAQAPESESGVDVKASEPVESPTQTAEKEVKKKVVAPPPPQPERPEVKALRKSQESEETIEGKVIGWNNGGLHVVVNGITAFCPRSEIELGAPKSMEKYLDTTMPFKVLRVQKRGRRIVLSRRAILQGDRNQKLETLRAAMRNGDILEGTVSSITDFGAFVDIGGIDGLVHISEISRARVEHPSEVVSEGDSAKVRVLKIGDDGKRVSLSMKALEPDPWDGIEDRFPAGEIVKGTVERTADFGAFVEIAPGLTGLLPTSAMNLPRNALPARIYQPGKEISVQILGIDRRRRRISLALEGSQVEGTRADLKSYQDKQRTSESSFGALAAAFERARKPK